jgi:hypothetical protein
VYRYRLSHALDENALITSFLQLNANYAAHTPVVYDCVPSEGGADYNSNSYARALLNILELQPPPVLNQLIYPGWQKPVPSNYFQQP